MAANPQSSLGWIRALVVNPGATGARSDVVATSTVSYTKSTLVDMPRRLQVLLRAARARSVPRASRTAARARVGRPRRRARKVEMPATSPRDTARRALDDDARPPPTRTTSLRRRRGVRGDVQGEGRRERGAARREGEHRGAAGRPHRRQVGRESEQRRDGRGVAPLWAVLSPRRRRRRCRVAAVLTATITPPPPSEGVPVRQSKVYESEEQSTSRASGTSTRTSSRRLDKSDEQDSVRLGRSRR